MVPSPTKLRQFALTGWTRHNQAKMSNQETNQLISNIIERLLTLNPTRVILFGSRALDQATANSDIDLLVVVDRDYIPQSYKEKSELYLQVSRQLRDIRQQVPVDLIVHTKPMYQKFIELNSMFSKEIAQKGIVLYEADQSGLAK